MKSYCWLFLLAACTGPSQVTIPAPTTPIPCPVCPEPASPQVVCPENVSSVCAADNAPKVTSDWYCMDVQRPDDDDVGFCWFNARMCEEKRKEVVAENLGTSSSACTTQPIAYCIDVFFLFANVWQAYCAKTPDGCQDNRAALLRNRPKQRHELGICRAVPNINPFEAMTSLPTDT